MTKPLTWPTDQAGQPLKLGDMTPTQRKEQFKASANRVRKQLTGPRYKLVIGFYDNLPWAVYDTWAPIGKGLKGYYTTKAKAQARARVLNSRQGA